MKKNARLLQLETRHQKIIQQILSKYPYKLHAYGLWTKGAAHKLSDRLLLSDILDAVEFSNWGRIKRKWFAFCSGIGGLKKYESWLRMIWL